MSIKIDTLSTKHRTIIDINKIGIPEIISIGNYRYSKPYRKLYPEVFDHFYEFIYIEKGAQEYLIEEEQLTLCHGQLLVIKPHEEHSTGQFFEKRGSVYWIIGNTFFSSFLGSNQKIGNIIINAILHSNNRITTMSNEFENILKNIFKIHSTIGKDSNIDKEIIKHNLFLLFTEIYNQVTHTSLENFLSYKDKRIMKSIKYIEHNIYDDINLDDLSLHIAFMSFSHFARMFKKTTGYTPRDFINLKKIEKAKELLQQNQYITTVSRNLGFANSQYFATVFKKYTGLTPSVFKKNLY